MLAIIRRQLLVTPPHTCVQVPQKANHCDLICDFLSWFEPPPDDPPPLPQQQPPVLSAPVMAPKVTTPAPQPAAMPCAPPKPSEPQPSGPPPSQEQQEEVEALQVGPGNGSWPHSRRSWPHATFPYTVLMLCMPEASASCISSGTLAHASQAPHPLSLVSPTTPFTGHL